jgi:FixJ family two-component response regulator
LNSINAIDTWFMTVHIIEDDPGVRDALSELCRAIGKNVVAYGDGETFLNEQSAAREDVVLVDLMLPGMSGADIIRKLGETVGGPKVIAISGLSAGEIQRVMRGLGDVPIMRKPLGPELVMRLF